jgi:hypothetical protein
MSVVRRLFFALVLGTITVFLGAAAPPGAGQKWNGNYPSLTTTATKFPWLVVKCKLNDVLAVQAGLDDDIDQFFTASGSGYGNLVDYFHDISYNAASVFARDIAGWVTAPFGSADLAFPPNGLPGRLAQAAARYERVSECLGSIPAEQTIDFSKYYGVVVINNTANDAGACSVGQTYFFIRGAPFQLACVWFDTGSLKTEFAAHEIGHGLGLDHSFGDSNRSCGGKPGEYCDKWDIMSAQGTLQFVDNNWLVAGAATGGGPGLNIPGLLRMGWLPANRIVHFNPADTREQEFTIRALSRALGPNPLVVDPLTVMVDLGRTSPSGGAFTIEYRQGDGWDRGFVSKATSPAFVCAQGGTVLVHEYRQYGAPASTLIEGVTQGALQPGNTLVLPGPRILHITVRSLNIADGSATVSIGFGANPAVPDLTAVRYLLTGARRAVPDLTAIRYLLTGANRAVADLTAVRYLLTH